MKMVIGYVALALGVLAGLGGLAVASRGMTLGWAALALAVPLVYVGFAQLRLRGGETAAPSDAEG